MSIILPDLSDVISGIIALGANGGERLFLPKIHTVLYQMKQHNRMIAGLWFSITGSVCYSRDVENVLRNLASQGVVKIEADSVVVKNIGFLRNRLSRMLPARQYRKLLKTSRKFYARLGTGSGMNLSPRRKTANPVQTTRSARTSFQADFIDERAPAASSTRGRKEL